MKEINLPYVSIKVEYPIVYFTYKEGAELGFPEIRELIFYAEKLSDHRPYVTFAEVLVDMNVTTEGKRVIADQNNMPLFRGTAVLVRNSWYMYAANFLNAFNKPRYPFKAFTQKEEAISWLKSLPLT